MILATRMNMRVLLGLVAVSMRSVGACITDMDCELLGTCAGGRCVCDSGWKGPSCSAADLQPTRSNSNNSGRFDHYSGYQNLTRASWGGRAVYENGTWHLFATEIAEGCPLILFMNNSQIIRATSKSGILGPYEKQETVLPAVTHTSLTVTHPLHHRSSGTIQR